MNRDTLYIAHIVEAIDRIQDYTKDGREFFLTDRKTYDAVIRNLQTMAESTQKLSSHIKSKYPDIEWDKIAGFRNVLVHDYLGNMNGDLIWEIVVYKLPELKQAMLDENNVQI